MGLERLLDTSAEEISPEELYTRITFPEPPEDRPYLFINMVATADGKIVIGDIGSSAIGVGGPTDQLLFRRLQKVGDAAMIGSGTLRASQVLYPPEKPRFVVTRSGNVPLENRFFTDAPDRSFVLAPADLPEAIKTRLGSRLLPFGKGKVDLKSAMHYLREEMGIQHLLCEGGASLNDDLIRAGLADELFLTLTPKLKGGSHLPTVVDGAGFPPGKFLPLSLLSLYRDGDEIYLRYRIPVENTPPT